MIRECAECGVTSEQTMLISDGVDWLCLECLDRYEDKAPE